MAYWYDGAALAATRSPVIALFWCLIKFTTTTTTTTTNPIYINISRLDKTISITKKMNSTQSPIQPSRYISTIDDIYDGQNW